MRDGHMIRLLGPIGIETPSGPLAVGGHRLRTLLGALAIAAGRAVPSDALMAAIWDDEPPDSADGTLQSYVSQLRHLLGAEAIVHVDHAYELVVGPGQIDVLRFQELIGEAARQRDQPERCRQLSREALALWRGRPFGDLCDEEPFQLEAGRLEKLRVAAMELSLAAELQLGNYQLAAAELECAVAEHPYRERLWHLLITALARDHRRVDALRACSRLRAVLADVGLTPGNELIALERQVLEDDLDSEPSKY